MPSNSGYTQMKAKLLNKRRFVQHLNAEPYFNKSSDFAH